MTNHHDRRITIPSDLWESLKYYVDDERLKVSDEVKRLITNESMLIQVLQNHLVKMGHYPPKKGSGMSCSSLILADQIAKELESNGES